MRLGKGEGRGGDELSVWGMTKKKKNKSKNKQVEHNIYKEE